MGWLLRSTCSPKDAFHFRGGTSLIRSLSSSFISCLFPIRFCFPRLRNSASATVSATEGAERSGEEVLAPIFGTKSIPFLTSLLSSSFRLVCDILSSSTLHLFALAISRTWFWGNLVKRQVTEFSRPQLFSSSVRQTAFDRVKELCKKT